MPANDGRMRLWSIGGGKGGIGKSLLTLGLGVSLARLGKRVILLDGDLGGANLHTLMGVRYPQVSLEHFLTKKVARLEDIIIETSIEGIGLICGADDLLGSANPTYSQKIRLLNQIEELPAQYVLMDLGAGISPNTLDFFNYSGGKIALFTSQTTSLQNAYGFIKNALYRKLSSDFARDDEVSQLIYQEDGAGGDKTIHSMQNLLNHFADTNPDIHARLTRALADYPLFLVLNMVKSHADLNYVEVIDSMCRDFLGIQPEIIGHVPFDAGVESGISEITSFLLDSEKSKFMAEIDRIAKRLVKESE